MTFSKTVKLKFSQSTKFVQTCTNRSKNLKKRIKKNPPHSLSKIVYNKILYAILLLIFLQNP